MHREVLEATTVLLTANDNAYLQALFGDRRNPRGTRISYALQKLETAALQKLIKDLQRVPGVKIQALMFDGAIIVIPDNQRALVDKVLDEFEDQYGSVEVRVKPW